MTQKPLTTKVVEGADARLEFDVAEIKVLTGPDRGATLTLGNESVLVGTSVQCGLVLHDASVSARHAEIQVSAKGLLIRDLGSTNGVRLGGQLVERAPLYDGARLDLGETSLVLRNTGASKSVPLARAQVSGGVVAHSVLMRAFLAELEKVAASDATILLEGETGAGKEIAAQAVHLNSQRKRGPFVVFDCSAVSPALAAAELFGAEKGAYTGADRTRPGLMEEADGGTLFIDEIGELPLEVQPLLLGALERRASRRVGGNRTIEHDLRIVAATNRNLAEEIKRGRFRQDLYYRLAVARLAIPPLRDRREDIPALVNHFARELNVVVNPQVLSAFSSYNWPGNVRELRNLVQRIGVFPDGVALPGADSGSAARPNQSSFSFPLVDSNGELRPIIDLRRLLNEEMERQYVQEALRRSGGSLTKAATLAGVTRQSFTTLADKHGLHPRGKD